ncbi:hypothetical protein, partial [Vibrio parahaemolyticus]|uniref:hypothetical protein n=1 Tax=Vibrio parahaemolyticus TaxID=670 RepID=UPI001A8C0888
SDRSNANFSSSMNFYSCEEQLTLSLLLLTFKSFSVNVDKSHQYNSAKGHEYSLLFINMDYHR